MHRALIAGLLALAATPAGAAALAVAPVPANPSSACAVGNPCSLDHALQIASSGDDIVMPPGLYSLTVQRNLNGVDIRGVAGQDAPQIIENSIAHVVVSSGEVRHVGVVQTGPDGSSGLSVGPGSNLEDAVVRCVNSCSAVIDVLGGGASVKNVVATGPKSLNGLEIAGMNVVLRNVTALVGGAGGFGIKGYTNGADTAIDVRNSIARGAAADLAFVQGSGTVGSLTYGWSDVRAGSTFLSGGSIVDLGHDVREDPLKIADLAGGDVHLNSDSALIDAGTADALGGPDLDGNPRVVGSAPDIGADEAYFAPPAAESGDATAIDTSSATIAGVITPAGHATSYRFEWGTTTAYGQATGDATAGNGSTAVPVTTALSGLAPDTVYHYRVVATSAFGTAAGVDRVLRTAAVAVVPPAATPPFAGALSRTTSARVDKRGRFTVTLACPASAVTTCTGTARLGLPLARPRKFSTAAGTTTRVRLTLTRAGRRLVGRKGLHTTLVVLAKDAAGREHAQARALLIRRR
jgi:hypothetical protein